MDIIDENMTQIQSSDNWEKKINLIKKTREMINKEKNELDELQENLDEELDDDIDFEDFDLQKTINKVQKSNNIKSQIENLKLLKCWMEQQKNSVFDS